MIHFCCTVQLFGHAAQGFYQNATSVLRAEQHSRELDAADLALSAPDRTANAARVAETCEMLASLATPAGRYRSAGAHAGRFVPHEDTICTGLTGCKLR